MLEQTRIKRFLCSRHARMKMAVLACASMCLVFSVGCGDRELERAPVSANQLFRLAYKNDWPRFTWALETYEGDINVHDQYGNTLLILSCYQSDTSVVEKLLEKKADINRRRRTAGGFDGSPLHASVYAGHAAIVKLLLDRGADINCIQESGKTPLFFALRRHPELTELLLKKGADVNVTDRHGWSPLQHLLMSTRKPEAAAVRLLLSYGADPAYRNPTPVYADSTMGPTGDYPIGNTPIEIAENGGYEDIQILLMEAIQN